MSSDDVIIIFQWRRGPSGKKSLCNACGLRFKKLLTRHEKACTDAGVDPAVVPLVIPPPRKLKRSMERERSQEHSEHPNSDLLEMIPEPLECSVVDDRACESNVLSAECDGDAMPVMNDEMIGIDVDLHQFDKPVSCVEYCGLYMFEPTSVEPCRAPYVTLQQPEALEPQPLLLERLQPGSPLTMMMTDPVDDHHYQMLECGIDMHSPNLFSP